MRIEGDTGGSVQSRLRLRVDLPSPHTAVRAGGPWDSLRSLSALRAPYVRPREGLAPSLVCPQLHSCGWHWAPGGGAVGLRRTGAAETWLGLQGAPQGDPRGLHRSAQPPTSAPHVQPSIRRLVSGGTSARLRGTKAKAPFLVAGLFRTGREGHPLSTAWLLGHKLAPRPPSTAGRWCGLHCTWRNRFCLHVRPSLRLPSPPARLWWPRATGQRPGLAWGSGVDGRPFHTQGADGVR